MGGTRIGILAGFTYSRPGFLSVPAAYSKPRYFTDHPPILHLAVG